MAEVLINRIAASGLITLDLEDYYPVFEIVNFDIKDYLFMEMIIKEMDFRKAMKTIDWSQYDGKVVTVDCSADAIVPMWAYMLIGTYLEGRAYQTYCGDQSSYLSAYYDKRLEELDLTPYTDKMVMIKGCGDKPVPPQAYLKLTSLLKPIAKSVMYGEPCSTVPIYKKPKTTI